MTVLPGIVPNCVVCCTTETNRANMLAPWILRIEGLHELGAQVLVEEQLHPADELARRRSRLAAKARQARISSTVRSGKSARICASVMPPARYSRTSYT